MAWKTPAISPVTLVRVAIIVAVLVGWEALAQSGLLYRDVVPSLLAIGKAIWGLLLIVVVMGGIEVKN